MENGIGIAEDAKVGESSAVRNEVLEQSVKENVDLSLDASKDSDGDEVFEEAVEAEADTVGSENSTTTKDGNVELVGTLENNKENSDLFRGVHKFEDVIGAPGAVQSSEDNHDEKQIVRDENGLTDGSITENKDSEHVEDGKADYGETDDSSVTAGETENLNDGYEKSNNSNQEPMNNVSAKMSFLEALTSGGAKVSDADSREEPNVEMPGTLEPNELSRAGADPEKLDVDACPHEITETQVANKVEGSDICSNIPESESLEHVNMVNTLNHGHIHQTLHENEGEDGEKESGVDPWSESGSNGDALHTNKQNAIPGSGNQQDKCENNSANLRSELEEDKVGEQEDNSRMGYENPKDDEVIELKNLDLESVQVEKKADTQDVNQDENSGIAASDASATNRAKESSGLDTNLHPVLDDSTLNLEKTEVEPQLSSAELLPESSGTSHPQLVDSSTEVSTNIVETQKQEGVEDEKKELYLSGNEEQEKVSTNLHPVPDHSTLNLEKTEVEPQLSSSELLPESSGSSHPQLVNASTEVSTNIVETQEQEGVEDEKKELYLSGNEEQEKVSTNLHPVSDHSTLNLEKTEVEPQLSSSELLPESSRSSQPQPVNASTKVGTNIIERQKQEGLVEDEKKDLYLSGNKEHEKVGPVTGISSTSDLDHAAKVQEPVSQLTSSNGKKDVKPASDISSSANSVTKPPAGLSQTTPLPEHASQKKVRGPDIPSSNITSATPARPAGLGRAAPLLEPTSRVVQQQPRVNGAVSAAQNQLIEDPTNSEVEEYDETREKLQMIRVKFLRLAHRLGQTPHNVVVAQVLYRLGLAEQLHGRSGGRVAAFSFDRASAMAEQLEAAGQEPLDFTCTIMVIGKSGVGKSATINSIFDEVMFGTDAFQLGTKKVQDIVGTVQGIRVRVIDTPGLLPSWSDQHHNEKILRSVKRFIKKTPPDIVLYLDRLDMQSREFGDMPLLRTITDIFGPSIWFNAIVVLTHAASAPPEGPNGTATSYDMFVTQRSHVVQQAIRQAAGDMRLMNPVSLVENHSACRTNRAGQRVLPNGQIWKPHLLLLSFASKILAEANTLLKLQDTPPGRPFAPRTRAPPLPFLLSSLLQSRPEIKLPSEQFGDDDDDAINDVLDEYSDDEEESEYDKLPPFKSLTKAELGNLSKVQRKAYYDELEYREKLFMKKQLKEERKRRKMMKKLHEAAKDLPAADANNNEEETGAAASVPVPMPDLALPASFDSDNPTHRYRSLDTSNQWLVRAVLEPNGWDHDIGYDGINVERLFVAKEKIPISFSGHISKDKKDTSIQMEVASSVKHGKGKATSLGFDMQSVGKDYAYTLRSETRFSDHRINKATAGVSATVLGDVVTGGLKMEDKLIIGKRGQLVVSGGAIYGRGEVAYGGSLEATLRDKDHPLGRFLSTLGISVMDWHGDLAIGCNSQTQIPIGRHTNLIGRLNINNRGSGQFSVKINSSEQLQIVLIGLIPLVKKIMGYSQQGQYG